MIVGFSGKKQSGKNTSANYLVGITLSEIGVIKSGFSITENGELYVNDIYGDTELSGIIDLNNRHPKAIEFMEENIYPYIKLYSFADLLKELCINLLGLTEQQCYGTDSDKNTLTNIKWENMPGVIVGEKPITTKKTKGRLGDYHESDDKFIYHAAGNMTAREVIQFVGTEIFRKMSGDVWANATLNKIVSEGSELAIITDCRFPNEVAAIQNNGGKVIRLLKNSDSKDIHLSETALDDFPLDKFDKVIDNRNLNILEANKLVHDTMSEFYQ